MKATQRHQCIVYDGSPSTHLSALAAVIKHKLSQNTRCLCINSPPMVVGLGSYLYAAGVNVVHEATKGRLVMSSDQGHLVNGHFIVDRMLALLDGALNEALRDGYQGLWATGDMSWEFGPHKDFTKLLDYEWRLEEYMSTHPALSGVCQYHTGTLPREVVRQGFSSHRSIFISETFAVLNPHYIPRESFPGQATDADVDDLIRCLWGTDHMK